jgi:hypothetical protein
MERSIYVNETTFEEMRRLKEQHDLPVIMVWSYLNNGKMRVILMYDERDYWMTIWLEDKARGIYEVHDNLKNHRASYRHEVVNIMQEKFIRHALPFNMSIGKCEDKNREVNIEYCDEDMILESWLVISSIDDYLNPRKGGIYD